MTDTVKKRLLRGAQVLRARADPIARAYCPAMTIRDIDADALANFAEAVAESLAASPQGEGSSGGPIPSKREVRLVLAARSVAFGGHFSPNAIKELDAASEAYAADVPWDEEPAGDCVCVQHGDGPEGCGLCNETGVVTSPASPQGEGDWIKHDGGPNPVPELRSQMSVRLKSGREERAFSDDFRWDHKGWDTDIIDYRVTEGVKP